jgi:hypothetical protein
VADLARATGRQGTSGGALHESKDFDILTTVDRRWWRMKLFQKPMASWVAVCDRCGEVCDRECRAEAVRERASLKMTVAGPRI